MLIYMIIYTIAHHVFVCLWSPVEVPALDGVRQVRVLLHLEEILYMRVYLSIYLFLSLSLSIYIYIYIGVPRPGGLHLRLLAAPLADLAGPWR